MPNPIDQQIEAALNRQESAIEVTGLEYDWVTGYLDGSGVLQSDPTGGLDAGYMYVHRPDARANNVAVLIGDRMLRIRKQAGRRCIVGYNIAGQRVAYAPMVDQISAAANAAGYLAYSTTWAGSSPSIGNGTLLMTYFTDGADVRFGLTVVMGSTTNFGSGTYTFTLPYAIATSGAQAISGYVYDSSPGAYYVTTGSISSSTLTLITNSGALGRSSPITFASGDTIKIGGLYQIV